MKQLYLTKTGTVTFSYTSQHGTVVSDENKKHSGTHGVTRLPDVLYFIKTGTVQHARKHEARMWEKKERLGIYIAMPSYQCSETVAWHNGGVYGTGLSWGMQGRWKIKCSRGHGTFYLARKIEYFGYAGTLNSVVRQDHWILWFAKGTEHAR